MLMRPRTEEKFVYPDIYKISLLPSTRLVQVRSARVNEVDKILGFAMPWAQEGWNQPAIQPTKTIKLKGI